ncbi:MAG: hypothetical protein F6J98_14015 [Moorea sp. SIO4G2]|nr:hypothetical protein [Moorena sp. SIO4G2]
MHLLKEIEINLGKPIKVYVATVEVEIKSLSGKRVVAIVMNPSTTEKAEKIDYLLTNVDSSLATESWFIETYAQRNWIEVFYR